MHHVNKGTWQQYTLSKVCKNINSKQMTALDLPWQLEKCQLCPYEHNYGQVKLFPFSDEKSKR